MAVYLDWMSSFQSLTAGRSGQDARARSGQTFYMVIACYWTSFHYSRQMGRPTDGATEKSDPSDAPPCYPCHAWLATPLRNFVVQLQASPSSSTTPSAAPVCRAASSLSASTVRFDIMASVVHASAAVLLLAFVSGAAANFNGDGESAFGQFHPPAAVYDCACGCFNTRTRMLGGPSDIVPLRPSHASITTNFACGHILRRAAICVRAMSTHSGTAAAADILFCTATCRHLLRR